jgi:hypothetical protein
MQKPTTGVPPPRTPLHASGTSTRPLVRVLDARGRLDSYIRPHKELGWEASAKHVPQSVCPQNIWIYGVTQGQPHHRGEYQRLCHSGCGHDDP